MWIDIEKLPVNLRLGFYAEERQHLQTAFVTLRIHIADCRPDLSKYTGSSRDDLSRTVDYAAVIRTVDQCLDAQEFCLVEAVVERIGIAVMETQPLCQRLDVKVVKTVLPRNCARGAEVSVSRSFVR